MDFFGISWFKSCIHILLTKWYRDLPKSKVCIWTVNLLNKLIFQGIFGQKCHLEKLTNLRRRPNKDKPPLSQKVTCAACYTAIFCSPSPSSCPRENHNPQFVVECRKKGPFTTTARYRAKHRKILTRWAKARRI